MGTLSNTYRSMFTVNVYGLRTVTTIQMPLFFEMKEPSELNIWGCPEGLVEVFRHTELPDDVREKLKHPKLSLCVSIPVRMDDGRLKMFTGYRVQSD